MYNMNKNYLNDIFDKYVDNMNRQQKRALKAEFKLLRKVFEWRKFKQNNNYKKTINSNDYNNIKNIEKFIENKFKNKNITNLWLNEISQNDYKLFTIYI